jgi:hypothetical protein
MATVSKVRKEKEAVFVADCTVANQEADIQYTLLAQLPGQKAGRGFPF